MAIANFGNGDSGVSVRTKLNKALDAALTIFVLNKGFDYPAGAVAIEGGSIYQANAVIPDGTAFAVGTTGATWKALGGASVSANDREFADDTTTAPAVTGKPTNAEIAGFAAAATITDTIIFYTGDDSPASATTYVFHVDASGNVTTLQTPAASSASTTLFNTTPDWLAGVNEYYYVVSAATHGITAPTNVQVLEDTGPTLIPVTTDVLISTADDSVTISVSDIPDGRFAGKIVIT